jgi:hypothetical protein
VTLLHSKPYISNNPSPLPITLDKFGEESSVMCGAIDVHLETIEKVIGETKNSIEDGLDAMEEKIH